MIRSMGGGQAPVAPLDTPLPLLFTVLMLIFIYFISSLLSDILDVHDLTTL